MTTTTTAPSPDLIEKIAALDNLDAMRDLQRMDYEKMRALILAPVAAALAELDAEYTDNMAMIDESLVALEADAKALVATHGASVIVGRMELRYRNGAKKWDAIRLERKLIALGLNPDDYYTIGNASVSKHYR